MVPTRRAQPSRVLTYVGLVSLLAGVLMSLPKASSADTANPPTTTTATVVGTGQTNVAPNGPLTGLANGSVVRVTVTAKAGNEGKFFGTEARLCRDMSPGQINSLAAFNPSDFGNCIDVPFNAASDNFVLAEAGPVNNTVTFDFRVGTGTLSVSHLSGTRTITCGDGNPCDLWLKQAVDTTLVPSGLVFIHYDLVYGTDSGTTTTSSTTSSTTPTTSSTTPTTSSTSSTSSTSPTTSSTISTTSTTSGSSTTTSTTRPGTTTSTSPGGTTTSTATGGTTTSTATGRTASTAVGGTTTSTVSGALTLSPTSVAPGDSISVTSSGWKAATQVTVSFNPTLGTITADASGRANGSFTIPVGTALGSHTMTLTGTGASGESRTLTAPFTVVASGVLGRTGAEAWRFSMAAIALILLGIAMMLLSAAQRRQLWA